MIFTHKPEKPVFTVSESFQWFISLCDSRLIINIKIRQISMGVRNTREYPAKIDIFTIRPDAFRKLPGFLFHQILTRRIREP